MSEIVIITGASSGIGRQTAIDMAKDGYTVIGGARHIENDLELQQKGVITRSLDVTSHQSVQDFVNFVLDQYHTIDILINSAGYGLFGALEEVSLHQAQNQMEVNLFGIVDLIQAVVPIMTKNKKGRIINISSLAGQSYSAMAGWYYISKHALETMSDVLRLELEPFGVKVIIVEPGITDTNWASVTNEKMLAITPVGSPYRPLAEKQASMITQATQTVSDVARVIVKSVKANRPKIRYQVRLMDKIAMSLTRLTSYRVQDWVAKRMMK